jgi:hypothetical protein
MAAAGTATENRRSGHDLLGSYLNDHLAGATGGVELARRMAGSRRSQPPEATLRRLAAEIAQDRVVLLEMMSALEMLRLGVAGKAAGWRTLRVAADHDSRLDAGRLDELISRARRQDDLLEELRVQAAERVVGTGGAVRAS